MNRSAALALGVFFVVASVYLAAAPGRIDIIDGQYRYEVARNLLESGSLQVRDPFLAGAAEGIGGRYSPYGIAGSIVSMPLVLLAKRLGPPSIDRQQFFFSLTSGLFGAATAALICFFYLELGIAPRRALVWTLVAAFATLAFPASTSVFDQTQHACFVIAGCLLAYLAGKRESLPLAVAGGLALAVLVNFQETYALMFPTLGLATLAPPSATAEQRARSYVRYAVFIAVASLGLVVWASLNYARYGHPLLTGKGTNHPAVFGNPIVGFTALLVSPGKSILLYSPPIALALLGLVELFRRERWLTLAIATASLAQLALISCLTFFGGDWCWGPRYLVPVLPLLALALPMMPAAPASNRVVMRTLIAAGVAVQLLAITVDHHRFFYARSLAPFFWHQNVPFYFRESALLSRPGELIDSIEHGVPAEAVDFRPGPYPERLTYAVFGPSSRTTLPTPEWMRHYRVFWLPRPWPLWMQSIEEASRPVNLQAGGAVLMAAALLGLAGIAYGTGVMRPIDGTTPLTAVTVEQRR